MQVITNKKKKNGLLQNKFATKKKMKLLELFSGTGSVGEPFRANGHEVIAVDIDGRFECEIQDDIIQLDYINLPFIPDVIWASPPCT